MNKDNALKENLAQKNNTNNPCVGCWCECDEEERRTCISYLKYRKKVQNEQNLCI